MAAISYIHPSVTSTITDNSITYTTATGTTKLFAVFTSEKGPDNRVKLITSTSEFLFHYGNPNMKLYGQVLYNVINWLDNNGGVYCLRVLPEDATYANAIVNIQAKEGQKRIKDVNGELVDFRNVDLRTTVIYSKVNAISKKTLEVNEVNRYGSTTVDGYTNYPLFAVIPKGRGKGYKGLGFTLSLNTDYESTYDFRLYNFAVTNITDSGAIDTIQGPFIVSLDPDAMSLTGETMFIENVLYKYCDYFDIIFSEKNYEALGKMVNPNVNPNCLDFITGITRVEDDKPETYYEELTGKDEDTHIALHKYNNDGEYLNDVNIADATNEVTFTIVDVDNTSRQDNYLKQQEVVETMKQALSNIRKNNQSYQNKVNGFKDESQTNPKEYLVPCEKQLKEASDKLAKINEATDLTATDLLTEEEIAADATATNKKFVVNAVEGGEKALNDAIECYMNIYSWLRVTGSTPDSVDFIADMENAQGRNDILKTLSLEFATIKSSINALRTLKEDAEMSELTSEKINCIATIIADIQDALDKLNALDKSEYKFADKSIELVKAKLVEIEKQYDVIKDENALYEDVEEAIFKAFTAMEDPMEGSIFDNTDDAIELILLEYKVDRIKVALNALYSEEPTEARATDHIKDLLYYVSGDPAVENDKGLFGDPEYLLDIAEFSSIITNYKDAVLPSYYDKTYTIVLHDFGENIPLLNGSDGSIDGELPSSEKVESLLVNGYLGRIDNSITDKDKYPIDVILDANHGLVVKRAMVRLATEIRDDFIAILDTKETGNAEQSIQYRKNNLNYNNFRVSIFTQDFIVTDSDYTNQKMVVTPTYYLSSKIPNNDIANGIHWNFVGPRRGVITGFDSISYIPNPEWKEQLYKSQVNYIEEDTISTRFASQNTSQHQISALSNISCVRCILRIQREVENLMKNYLFEWNDNITIQAAQAALNGYLSQWLANRACTNISGSVYSSEYDKKQKILRVKIEITFNAIIERIIINLNVNG